MGETSKNSAGGSLRARTTCNPLIAIRQMPHTNVIEKNVPAP